MKVYFNNSCKICKAEIDLYKKEKIQDIDWIDITNNSLAKEETSKNSKELLRRLHVKDGEKVLEGAEAFLLVWKKIPRYRFLYNFFKLPIIFNIFSFTYDYPVVGERDISDLDDKDFVRLRRKKNKIILFMYSIVLIMFISSMSLLSKFFLFFFN